jgi:hypothetical protein
MKMINNKGDMATSWGFPVGSASPGPQEINRKPAARVTAAASRR